MVSIKTHNNNKKKANNMKTYLKQMTEMSEKGARISRELTGFGSPLFNQLKAIKAAKEAGICFKCDEEAELENEVCANC
jgi:hypothetical protein